MSYRVGIDIGGTFTDFALLKGREIVLDKTLSTPEDPSIAVMTGLEQHAAREGLSLREFLGRVVAIVHGTTISDNTLIQMNGAKTGLLTTQGFRDEIELRLYHGQNSAWNLSRFERATQTVVLNQTRPEPIVAAAWSKADGVGGSRDSDYSLYLDLVYLDGTPLWGQVAPFNVGTHGWEKVQVTVFPEKPGKSQQAA